MTRREIVTPEELRGAIRRVVDDYEAFVARGPSPGTHDDAKAFAAHHSAAKSALTNLEYLLKLARSAGAGEEQGVAEAGALLRQARSALVETAEAEEACEDDDGPSG